MVYVIQNFIIIYGVIAYIGSSTSIILKKECPPDEVHKSCAFIEEYTCWVEEDRWHRVRSPPARLSHCRSGCYCKKDLVREYPGGHCIAAAGCQDQSLQATLKKMPTKYGHKKK